MKHNPYDRKYPCDICGEYVYSDELTEVVIGDIEVDFCRSCLNAKNNGEALPVVGNVPFNRNMGRRSLI